MTASYSLTHLTDGDLLQSLSSLVAQDRVTTAQLVAHLAEVGRRELHLPAGYPSLLDYCTGALRMSRDEALKRLRVAALARRFPVIFGALADGRLTLTTVDMLRQYLRPENARELLKAALNRSKSELEAILAARFPTSELLNLVDRIPSVAPTSNSAVVPEQPIQVAASAPMTTSAAAPGPTTTPSRPVKAPAQKLTPIAEERFGLHMTMPRSLRDRLAYLQELLSHSIPSGDMAEVLEKAADLAIAAIEKRKFGVTSRSRSPKGGKPKGRYIPLDVRRKVLARDGHQCTFVSATGKRCSGRKFLEFHHDETEFARGGEPTESNLCLRCRAHNAYAAEQTYGAGFMEEKREAARRAAAARRAG
jgi:hypothetical protein